MTQKCRTGVMLGLHLRPVVNIVSLSLCMCKAIICLLCWVFSLSPWACVSLGGGRSNMTTCFNFFPFCALLLDKQKGPQCSTIIKYKIHNSRSSLSGAKQGIKRKCGNYWGSITEAKMKESISMYTHCGESKRECVNENKPKSCWDLQKVCLSLAHMALFRRISGSEFPSVSECNAMFWWLGRVNHYALYSLQP